MLASIHTSAHVDANCLGHMRAVMPNTLQAAAVSGHAVPDSLVAVLGANPPSSMGMQNCSQEDTSLWCIVRLGFLQQSQGQKFIGLPRHMALQGLHTGCVYWSCDLGQWIRGTVHHYVNSLSMELNTEHTINLANKANAAFSPINTSGTAEQGTAWQVGQDCLADLGSPIMAPECLEDGVAAREVLQPFGPCSMTDKVHSSTERGSQLLYSAIQYMQKIQSRADLCMWNTKGKWHWLENDLDVKTTYSHDLFLSQSVTAKLDMLITYRF